MYYLFYVTAEQSIMQVMLAEASFFMVHEEKTESAEGQSKLTHCQSVWHCVMIIRITSSRIMEPEHIQPSLCAVPEDGPVCCEYSAFKWSIRSQTNTDSLHTNDRRGPGVRQGTRHVSVRV